MIAWEERVGWDAIRRIGFRMSHDESGNWTVSLPGTVQHIGFRADAEPSVASQKADAESPADRQQTSSGVLPFAASWPDDFK